MTNAVLLPSGPGEAGREGEAPQEPGRLAVAPAAFTLLTTLAARRERITYADFAFDLGLRSPRNLGWLLTPLLRWCASSDLPPLAIIVVRRADGLPSGGYDPDTVAADTQRVFDQDWSALAPPGPGDLARFALLPHPLARPRSSASRRSAPC